MRLTSFTQDPLLTIPFLNAGRGAGMFYTDQLPIHLGIVAGLPEELDALIVTADLQGRERFNDSPGPPKLLGEVLPRRLCDEVLPGLEIRPERCGAILAGDLYTVPNLDRRGGSGDVSAVWRAFGQAFKWVVGVAGNHDAFGESPHPTGRLGANQHYLDGDTVKLEGLLFAGVGGIIGNPRKPHRRTDDAYLSLLDQVMEYRPDVLVTHDGPDSPDRHRIGSPLVRELLELHQPTLTIRGHAHWKDPFLPLPGGGQVLNVDCRVAILRLAA